MANKSNEFQSALDKVQDALAHGHSIEVIQLAATLTLANSLGNVAKSIAQFENGKEPVYELDKTLENAKNFIMPIGKHAGKKLMDIDREYLLWFQENADGYNRKIGELCGMVLRGKV